MLGVDAPAKCTNIWILLFLNGISFLYGCLAVPKIHRMCRGLETSIMLSQLVLAAGGLMQASRHLPYLPC